MPAPRSPAPRCPGPTTAEDLLAWVAALFTVAAAFAGLVTLASGGGSPPAPSGPPGLGPLAPLVVPAAAMVALLVALACHLPDDEAIPAPAGGSPRWRRPLYALGAPAIPVILMVRRMRDLRTSKEPRVLRTISSADARARWLSLPRWLELRLAAAAAASIAPAALLGEWGLHSSLAAAALAAALVAIGTLGAGLFARHALLLHPGPPPPASATRPTAQTSLRRLWLALGGLLLAPVVTGAVWLGEAAAADAKAAAMAAVVAAIELEETIEGDDAAALGALLADHPGLTLRSPRGTLYGRGPAPAEASGEVIVARRGAAAAALSPTRPQGTGLPPFTLLALGSLCALLVAAGITASRVHRLDRAIADALRGATAPAPRDSPGWRALRPRIAALRRLRAEVLLTSFAAEEALEAARAASLRRLADALGPPAATRNPPANPDGLARADLDGLAGMICELAALAEAQPPPPWRPITAASLVAEAITGARLRSPGLAVAITLPPGLPPIVGDRPALSRALRDLLVFARPASPTTDGETLELRVTPRSTLGIAIELEIPTAPLTATEAERARRPLHHLGRYSVGIGRELALARADALIRRSCGRLSLHSRGSGLVIRVELPAASLRASTADERTRQ